MWANSRVSSEFSISKQILLHVFCIVNCSNQKAVCILLKQKLQLLTLWSSVATFVISLWLLTAISRHCTVDRITVECYINDQWQALRNKTQKERVNTALTSHSTHNGSFQSWVFSDHVLHWQWQLNSQQPKENTHTKNTKIGPGQKMKKKHRKSKWLGPSSRTRTTHISVLVTAQLWHTIAPNSSDNLPSYPTFSHHWSDGVY